MTDEYAGRSYSHRPEPFYAGFMRNSHALQAVYKVSGERVFSPMVPAAWSRGGKSPSAPKF